MGKDEEKELQTREKLEEVLEESRDLANDIEETLSLGEQMPDPKVINKFRARISRLDATYEKFTKFTYDAKRFARSVNDKKILTEIKCLCETVKNQYYDALAINLPIEKNCSDRLETTVGGSPYNSISCLPKIKLPVFDGDISEWPVFKDTFVSLVHENVELSPIRKFQYLKTSLSKIALKSISAIPITEIGYAQAWDILIKTFDNPRLQAVNYLSKLFNFKPISRASLSTLQDFSSVVLESAQAFKNLNLTDGEGFILLTFALSLLDDKTRDKFEEGRRNKRELPTFSDFSEFMTSELNIYRTEMVSKGRRESVPVTMFSKGFKGTKKVLISTDSSQIKDNSDCPLCNQKHKIEKCTMFLKFSPHLRFKKLRCLKSKICFLCLHAGHTRYSCIIGQPCKICASRTHHTLLHFDRLNNTSVDKGVVSDSKRKSKLVKTADVAAKNTITTNKIDEPSSSSVLSNCVKGESYVLLGTAIGRIKDCYGNYQKVRMLIDNGAQKSFITTACSKRLGLKLTKGNHSLSGFGNQPISGGRDQTSFYLVPVKVSSPEISISAVVTPVITSEMPLTPIPDVSKYFHNIILADPNFSKPAEVDMLLGADSFGSIYKGDLLKSYDGGPYALNTIFGWIIMGPIESKKDADNSVLLLTSPSTHTLESLIQQFWLIEEVNHPTLLSQEEEECEKFFEQTCSRDNNGRYVVRLPFKKTATVLGDSYGLALRRFYSLEQKLNKDRSLKNEYNNVIKEYLSLGYLVPASGKGKYYLAHHGVLKESSTTRLRIVFDASMKTSEGSLNDKLHIGPKLQKDIRVILASFRTFLVALVADIKHMYLQIVIHEEDRGYQHMLYRFESSDQIEEYELNRLTFGMSSSPYLALKVLRKIALESVDRYPLASKALLSSTYMDDILSGGSNVAEAKELQVELIALLGEAGFQLQKWASNEVALTDNLSCPHKDKVIKFTSMEDNSVKILGMQWDPIPDCLFYTITTPILVRTKRAVLSAIARIFDPLGFLAPVVFRAKSFLQQLWSQQLGWDSPLPTDLAEAWQEFVRRLPALSQIKIQRCLFAETPCEITLIGFSDASTLGYAAVIYLRMEYRNKSPTVKLFAAKTRLAPIKVVSVPRLELCASLLLIRLIALFSDVWSSLKVSRRFLFSDSTVVLSWLRLPPNALKVFVGNRTSEIMSLSQSEEWHHISSKENAADVASRGIYPDEIVDHTLWWEGPAWLRDHIDDWPITHNFVPLSNSETPEKLVPKNVFVSVDNENKTIKTLLESYSSFNKLRSVVAYVLRFKNNTRCSVEDRKLGELSIAELTMATNCCIKLVQGLHFQNEIKLTLQNLGHKTKFKALAPFIDTVGVLRVGGRLSKSPLPYNAKHPILLPNKCHFTNLLIDYLHVGYLHAGPKLLFSLIQRRYWISSGRQTVRYRIHQCLVCRKQKPSLLTPYMADLPSSRFEQGRAFLNVGVDYAGPYLLKESKLRNSRISKAYLCIFICMSSKAIHLELVSELSTDAFLACLDRFISRRGLPSKIFSDHGTNFVGAQRYLQDLYSWLKEENVKRVIHNHLTEREVQWIFNPPAASHMAGLWEAGVKSVKTHLSRVLGNQRFTFEEMYTVLTRIEALLNSRPLYALTTNPDDYSVLTPGHFLTGDALVAAPEQNFTEVVSNRLSRWQFLNQCIQHVWNKWRLDYLNSLQQRMKWTDKSHQNLVPGTLVLLKESSPVPTQWPTARILEVYPGSDGRVRVVKVRTAKGDYVRPVAKLALLLPNDNPRD